MPAYVVLGAQWGDEGKGKVVDVLTTDRSILNPDSGDSKPEPVDMVVRFNGSNNAGHTVRNPHGDFMLHLLPGGMATPDIRCAIGPYVNIDFFTLYNDSSDPKKQGEFQALQSKLGNGIEDLHKRLSISKNAVLTMPWHILEDMGQEMMRSDTGLSQIGTTRRGNGPAYADRVSRSAFRVRDLLDAPDFIVKFYREFERKVDLLRDFYHIDENILKDAGLDDAGSICDKFLEISDKFLPCFKDIEPLIQQEYDRNSYLLFEGAQGYLLDVDDGTYPNVTSSRTGIAAAYSCGLDGHRRGFNKVIGVAKAYTTRVGNGPFPTEMDEKISHTFREHAGEYGVTTGRPRRIGWLDLPALRYFVEMNGVDKLVVTRLDILDNFDDLRMGVSYSSCKKHEPCLDFRCVVSGTAEVAYTRGVPSWGPVCGGADSVRDAECFEALPQNAKNYCNILEVAVAPLLFVSNGPKREDTLPVK